MFPKYIHKLFIAMYLSRVVPSDHPPLAVKQFFPFLENDQRHNFLHSFARKTMVVNYDQPHHVEEHCEHEA